MAQSSASRPVLRIGTRGSPLALAQARAGARPRSPPRTASTPSAIAIEVIRTTGDAIQDRPLAEVGGKGLFTKEIEEALLGRRDRSRGAFGQGHADRAAAGPGPRRLPAARGCARRLHQPQGDDACASLPPGAVVGTASLRRQALVQAAAARSRGRAAARQCRDAAAQARRRRGRRDAAGARRPEAARPRRRRDRAARRSTNSCRRSGRASIAIEARADDAATRALLAAIDHAETRDRARRRARLPRRARRLLPHADRRPCHDRATAACASAA